MLLDFFNPPLPPQITAADSVWIAQAVPSTVTRPSITSFNAVYEVCRPVETQIPPGGDSFAPGTAILLHWEKFPKQKIGNGDLNQAKVSVLEPPKYGTLAEIASKPGDSYNDSGPGYSYKVNEGTPNGTEDRIVFLIEIGGKRLKVIERLIMVFNSTPASTECNGKDFYVRRISQFVEDVPPTNSFAPISPYLYLQDSLASGVRYNFGALDATALAQTIGEGLNAQITLDTTAAGHGWYIDPTPLDSSDDYLPTSNPTVFQAKAGSAAEGKMDMLSVLLHEYGHALGLEHSGNGADFMAASLQPGVRKLPSAAELTLMSQLVAELKGAGGEALTLALSQGEREQDNPFAPSPLSALGLLPFGLMRRNDGKGSANAAVATGAATASHIDYLTAINTTLANGSLHARQNASIDQWQSVGNVAATPATASQGVTLGESTTAQAHLAQAFILSAQDRFLTFTVSGLDLQTNSTEQNGVFTAAPQDAFEVALQNANTGANLLANSAGGVGNYHF